MASLLTGAPPEAHGLKSDRFHLPRPRRRVDPMPRVLAAQGLPTHGYVRELPLLFRSIGRRIATHLGVATASFRGRTAMEIALQAGPRLADDGDEGLLLLHWPDCDVAGHAHGWMSEPYVRAAHRLDLALGMVARLADVGRDPGTLLVALADHGGGGVDPKDHESDHPADRTIPVLLAGAAVQPGELGPCSLLDVPATVLWALGVEPPPSYAGRPLVEAFATPARQAQAG
jgi:hypothetical protein